MKTSIIRAPPDNAWRNGWHRDTRSKRGLLTVSGIAFFFFLKSDEDVGFWCWWWCFGRAHCSAVSFLTGLLCFLSPCLHRLTWNRRGRCTWSLICLDPPQRVRPPLHTACQHRERDTHTHTHAHTQRHTHTHTHRPHSGLAQFVLVSMETWGRL